MTNNSQYKCEDIFCNFHCHLFWLIVQRSHFVKCQRSVQSPNMVRSHTDGKRLFDLFLALSSFSSEKFSSPSLTSTTMSSSFRGSQQNRSLFISVSASFYSLLSDFSSSLLFKSLSSTCSISSTGA